jgi:hypothetical protein
LNSWELDLPVLAAASVAHAAQGEHEHKELTGPLANATVSFGAWRSERGSAAPIDSPYRSRRRGINVHALLAA